MLRGYLWPQSVYGITLIEPWRWVEHTGWVAFEDIFLIWSCHRSIREMWSIAERQAELEVLHGEIGRVVERRTAELRESQTLQASIIQTVPDAIMTMNHLGLVVEFNPAAESMFGYSREHVLGRSLDELIIPAHQRPAYRAALGQFLVTGKNRILGRRLELKTLRADGTEFLVEVTISSVRRQGTPPLFVGLVRDLTERRCAEETNARLAAIVDSTD